MERFKAHHRSNDPFNGAMILLHDIIRVFDLTKFYTGFVIVIVTLDDCGIGAALNKWGQINGIRLTLNIVLLEYMAHFFKVSLTPFILVEIRSRSGSSSILQEKLQE